MRILFLAYNHVAFAAGGAQQMACEMSRAADAAGHVTHQIAALEPADAAKVGDGRRALTAATHAPGLSFFRLTEFDPDLLSGVDPGAYAELRAFIGRFRPDVIHFHHVLRWGVEAIVAARMAAPGARITLGFHEMVAICPANGQMVKPRTRTICAAASPRDCAECEPKRSLDFFALRASRLKAALSDCDAYVFPSLFLARLHVDWGLEAGKCVVIAHGVVHPAPAFDRSQTSAQVNRFAFFGQMIDNKGVDVALSALLILAREKRIPTAGLEFQIHGANRAYASPEFVQRVDALAREVARVSSGRIRVVDAGPYRRDQLAERMAGADWVVVPSTWGEAFALVVSEAWMFGRPVIATAAGALAERVRDGVDGFLFPLRDPCALADRIAAVSGDAALWRRLSAAISPPPTPEAMLAAYVRLWTAPLRPPVSLC